jgi:hypothetical protein
MVGARNAAMSVRVVYGKEGAQSRMDFSLIILPRGILYVSRQFEP